MSGYPDWRQMWDESGPWRPTVDDVATLLAEIDRQTAEIEALRSVVRRYRAGWKARPAPTPIWMHGGRMDINSEPMTAAEAAAVRDTQETGR